MGTTLHARAQNSWWGLTHEQFSKSLQHKELDMYNIYILQLHMSNFSTEKFVD